MTEIKAATIAILALAYLVILEIAIYAITHHSRRQLTAIRQ